MTTPLLEGTDGVEKMSKSLDNCVGVTDGPDHMYAKLMSISDALMWRYYTLLTDLTTEDVEVERAAARPMESKLALARRIVSDFHGAGAAAQAEAEWRRIHQARQAPRELPEHRLPAGRYKPHQLLTRVGLARSGSEAARLVRQRAVRRDGTVVEAAAEIDVGVGQSMVLQVGSRQFVRVTGTQ
jgi:tyrosyl-tRNA synthetase